MKKFLAHPRVRLHIRQMSRFIVCGLLGAVMEFSLIYLLVGRLAITPVVAYIFTGGIPSVFVFLFNRHVTFGATGGSTKQQTKRFVIVYMVTFVLNYFLSTFFYLFGLHVVLPLPALQKYAFTPLHITYAAKVIAIAVTAVLNYSFSHVFIFKGDRQDADILVPLIQL